MADLATIILDILKYVKKMLNLKISICLYQRVLNHLNIIYTIALIISSSFKNFNFLILLKIADINNIKKNRALAIYLQNFLPNKLKNRSKDII